jgi:anti-sigma factor RsiW
MNCVSESVLRAYHDGELDRLERPEIEKHLATCAQCGNRLQEIVAASGRVQ